MSWYQFTNKQYNTGKYNWTIYILDILTAKVWANEGYVTPQIMNLYTHIYTDTYINQRCNDLSRLGEQDPLLHIFYRLNANWKLPPCEGHNIHLFFGSPPHDPSSRWGVLVLDDPSPSSLTPFHSMKPPGSPVRHDDMPVRYYTVLPAQHCVSRGISFAPNQLNHKN